MFVARVTRCGRLVVLEKAIPAELQAHPGQNENPFKCHQQRAGAALFRRYFAFQSRGVRTRTRPLFAMRQLLFESPMRVSGTVRHRHLYLWHLQFAAAPLLQLQLVPDQRSRHRALPVPDLPCRQSLPGDASTADLSCFVYPAQAV